MVIWVALPVWVKTHTLSPKLVSPEPTREMNCPAQITIKVRMVLGLWF
jgi:hypothetical protein